MMRFADVLEPGRIRVGVEARDKAGALRAASELLSPSGDAAGAAAVERAMGARETLSSTGVGNGVAIPHALIDEAGSLSMAVLRLGSPVDFGASDGRPVDLVFAIVGPRDGAGEHLRILSKLIRVLHDPAFRVAAREAADGRALGELIMGKG